LLKYADDAALYPDVRQKGWHKALQSALLVLGAWARRWCMEFNSKKSQVVWFTRRQDFSTKLRYDLCGFRLQAVDTYRYLGMQMSSDLQWTAHIGTLVKRACHDAFLVRRMIDHKSDFPIHFGTVRSITNSHLLPRWTYGLALLPTTPQIKNWLSRAESELCSTIRAVLGLPRSTHKLSVLIEAGLKPMAVYADYQRLRLAHNMSHLSAGHATAGRYTDGLSAAHADDQLWTGIITAGRARPAYRNARDPSKIHSFYRTLLSIESTWGVLHQSLDDVARKTVAAAYRSWTASPGGAVLKSIRHHHDSRHIGRSHYLYLDTAVHARTRAAFRLDRVQTNGSMFRMNRGRAGTTPTPDCPCCPGVEESIPHIITDCPLYVLHRTILSRVASIPIDATFLHFVLGAHITDANSKSDDDKTARRHELRLTGDFLVSILVTRGVPPR